MPSKKATSSFSPETKHRLSDFKAWIERPKKFRQNSRLAVLPFLYESKK
jgi:hypothetical protein